MLYLMPLFWLIESIRTDDHLQSVWTLYLRSKSHCLKTRLAV